MKTQTAEELADMLERIDCTHADARSAAAAIRALAAECRASRARFLVPIGTDSVTLVVAMGDAWQATDTLGLLKGPPPQ